MRLLSVSPHVPFDGVAHAGGVYLLRHLEVAATSHDVMLWVPHDATGVEHVDRVPGGILVVVGSRPDHADAGGIVRRIVCKLALPALEASAVEGLIDAGLEAAARRADVVELQWSQCAVLAPLLRRRGVRTPIVVVEHDIESEAMDSRGRAWGGPLRRFLAPALHRLRRRDERRRLAAADLVVVFKAQDVDTLRRMRVKTPIVVTDPFIVHPSGDAAARRSDMLLFTGAMWRRENIDGVLWFLDHVWGPVRDACPNVTFTIAGALPTPDLLDAIREHEGVVATGWVPDLDPYYRTATAFVAPLLVAGGLKFKVAQAMAYGLPVVATPVAAAGIVEEVPPGTFACVTGDPVKMAAAIADLLRAPDRAQAIGDAASAWAARRYDFAQATVRLAEAYEALSFGKNHPDTP